MIEMGIIDPLRVVRSALQNGASVAGLRTFAEEIMPAFDASPMVLAQV